MLNISFCMGGGQTFNLCSGDLVTCGIACYGRISPTFGSNLKKPCFGIFAGADLHIPAAQVDELRTSLEKRRDAGDATCPPFKIKLYENVGHGFVHHEHPEGSFEEKTAQIAFSEAMEWLNQYMSL